MPKIHIEEILSKQESQKLEFKALIDLENDRQKKEIAKDFIAMANAKGGRIVIGYYEKTRKVIGVPREWNEERLRQIIVARSHPPVRFQTQFAKYNGKILVVIAIPESKLKPHQDSERNVWIRRGTITDRADPREVADMIYQRPKAKSKKISRKPMDEGRDEENSSVNYDINYETQAGIFEILQGVSFYRSCKLLGEFAKPAHYVVFLPSFDFYRPTPEFGDTKSVLLLEAEDIRIFDHSMDAFQNFLRYLESSPHRLLTKYTLWDISRLYWTLRVEENLIYGIGAQQAFQAIKDYASGIFNGVIQFGFNDLYNPTSLLHICYEISSIKEKELHVRDLELRLMLSTIPTDWELANRMFRSLSPLMKSREMQHSFPLTPPQTCTLRKIGYLLWRPKTEAKLPFQPIATLGRESSDEPEYDLSQGVIVKGSIFQNVDYELDEEDSWMVDWYSGVYKQAPIHCLEEIPITITNPVPIWEDFVKKIHSQVSPPRIRQIIFGALRGHLVSCLNFHGIGSLFESSEAS